MSDHFSIFHLLKKKIPQLNIVASLFELVLAEFGLMLSALTRKVL